MKTQRIQNLFQDTVDENSKEVNLVLTGSTGDSKIVIELTPNTLNALKGVLPASDSNTPVVSALPDQPNVRDVVLDKKTSDALANMLLNIQKYEKTRAINNDEPSRGR